METETTMLNDFSVPFVKMFPENGTGERLTSRWYFDGVEKWLPESFVLYETAIDDEEATKEITRIRDTIALNFFDISNWK